MPNESEMMAARRLIFEAAQEMLAGKISYIEGARKICPTRFLWGLDEWDADLRCFIGIKSETDALPLGALASRSISCAPARNRPNGRVGARVWRAVLPTLGREVLIRPNRNRATLKMGLGR